MFISDRINGKYRRKLSMKILNTDYCIMLAKLPEEGERTIWAYIWTDEVVHIYMEMIKCQWYFICYEHFLSIISQNLEIISPVL